MTEKNELGKKMGANLITSLQEIRDFRASQDRRYPKKANFAISNYGNNQWMPKLLRPGRLWARHYETVSERLGLKVTRLPSDTTFRRVLQKMRFSNFGTAVRAMGQQNI